MTITIHFETSAQLPPPYSYSYTLALHPSGQLLNADLKLTYTHRDELDADEIEAEGFSENDDYQWRGNLESVWYSELEKVLKKTHLVKDFVQDEDQDFLVVEWDNETNTQKGQPHNNTEWLYFAQEILQAIFETSGKERAFELYVADIQINTQREVSLTASFKTRKAQVKLVVDGKSSLRYYPWLELPVLMQALYSPDWLADKANDQKPKKPGLYLNPGDGLWYEFGRQIVEIGPRSSTLSALRSLIMRLFN